MYFIASFADPEIIVCTDSCCLLSESQAAFGLRDDAADHVLAAAPAKTGSLADLLSALQVTEVYQERRLDAVFALWDQNSDLRISFKELCEGLYR